MGERYISVGMGNAMPESALRAAPHINWRHIDGPLLSWAGQSHWLTWRERFALRFGRTTPEAVARKVWPLAIGWCGTVARRPDPAHPGAAAHDAGRAGT